MQQSEYALWMQKTKFYSEQEYKWCFCEFYCLQMWTDISYILGLTKIRRSFFGDAEKAIFPTG